MINRINVFKLSTAALLGYNMISAAERVYVVILKTRCGVLLHTSTRNYLRGTEIFYTRH